MGESETLAGLATVTKKLDLVLIGADDDRCFLGGHLDGRNVLFAPFPRHDSPRPRLTLGTQLGQLVVLCHWLLWVKFRVLPSTLVDLGIPTIRVHNALSF